MNIFLWIMQILLAFWNITGAGYMMGHVQSLATVRVYTTLPQPFWLILGSIQMLFAVGLVVPNRPGVPRNHMAISAYGLAAISLLGTLLYSSYAGFPGMLWGVLPALAAAFVGYRRMQA